MTQPPGTAAPADHSEHEDQPWTINIPGHPVRSDSPEYVRSRLYAAFLEAAPAAHTGVVPAGGGVHHYPSPITEIAFFKHDDFRLWVTDPQGNPAAVAPVSPRGSGDGRVHVLYATPGSALASQVSESEAQSQPLILDPGHPLAQQAFREQDAPR